MPELEAAAPVLDAVRHGLARHRGRGNRHARRRALRVGSSLLAGLELLDLGLALHVSHALRQVSSVLCACQHGLGHRQALASVARPPRQGLGASVDPLKGSVGAQDEARNAAWLQPGPELGHH